PKYKHQSRPDPARTPSRALPGGLARRRCGVAGAATGSCTMPGRMHTDARTDFRLYHSNALDVLAGLLATELRTPAPGQGLQAPLAQAHGVAANLEFLTPGEFVQRALDANVPGRGDDLDAAALRWRIHAALADPALLRERALQPLRAYLEGAPDPLKAWSL